MGHDPGHQRPFFASNWENRTKTEQKQKKIRFFATCLAFCREKLNKRPDLLGRPHCKGVAIGVALFSHIKTQNQPKKRARSRKKQKQIYFFPPDPGTSPPLRRPHPGLTPAPSLPEGRATPGSAPRNVARPRGTAAMPGVCPTSPRPGVFRVFRVRELAGRSGSSSKTPPLNPPRR